MEIERIFTKNGNPYQGISFEKRISEIKDPEGKRIFRQEDVTVPSFWSQVATDILAQKYFRKSGVPLKNGKKGRENDARQVFHRLSYTWSEWGGRYGYFHSDEDKKNFYDEICYMLAHQMAAPNSPQWFNTGLFSVYGIKGPAQGHYYIDPDTGKLNQSGSAYERPQPHACFILPIEDTLVNKDGIMELLIKEARLFKYGSGTGTNFSRLRGKGEPLSGGGFSSGLLSFLKIGDRSASAIKSGGTTRRAAKMITLDADHPDIKEYIDWKIQEEYKVACLVTGSKIIKKHTESIISASMIRKGNTFIDPEKNQDLYYAVKDALEDHVPPGYIYRLIHLLQQGKIPDDLREYTVDWEGEAYNSVSGQAVNNSIRVSNEFMQAVLDDKEWVLTYRTNGKVKDKIRARELWEEITCAAWSCADPALQFHTTINEWHTCPEGGEIRASNPCSEYMFLDDTACNLASFNLVKFYDKEKGIFAIEEFLHAVSLWTIVLEISVLMAQYPGEELARRSYDYRTIGLGFANLGSLLMQMGIPYDSDKGRNITAALSALLTGQAYRTSAMIAKELGPFPKFQENREHMLKVIRNHHNAALNKSPEAYEDLSVTPVGLNQKYLPREWIDAVKRVWNAALTHGQEYGYRNAQVSAIAPTGTIGLIMDCDTTGIEPDFSLVKFKRFAGGMIHKLINTSMIPSLRKLGYPENKISDIISYCAGHRTLHNAPGISLKQLKEKGFSDQMLQKIEQETGHALSITHVITPEILGKDRVIQHLGFSLKTIEQPRFHLLKSLGFTPEEIEKADNYACGMMTIEGAPHLKKSDYPVFDTANPGGNYGRRFISPGAHIKMMAAIQPFVSGAISKTINLPAHATIEEVKQVFLSSWQKMLKSISIYRDCSKLSQPLYSRVIESDSVLKTIFKNNAVDKKIRTGEKDTSPAVPGRSTRTSLPPRRKGYTQKAKIGGHSIFLRTGDYTDGRLGEIFLDMYKEGAAFRSLLNSFAIAVSLGLQYGVPLEEYVDAFTFTRFEPNGIVQDHENIRMATSVLDFIFRDLALNYLKRIDLVQVKPDDLISTGTMETKEEQSPGDYDPENPSSIARLKGYEGDPCSVCGHFTLIRNGTCLKCETCGATTGCS
ncbi:MAG: adenosylcobalamin-dependent ribonucleoside-diphosphate reductase [Spirochaetales bacterium]|nr:adenosylcobalamin-dependent ribonucleoside-diphosphate reductase [Spirochaetales bacterium]